MTRRLIVRPEAESDITEAALWYESRESGLGLELIAEIRAAIGRALNVEFSASGSHCQQCGSISEYSIRQ
jgi:hypothetical protein